jgi:hypothetical protein
MQFPDRCRIVALVDIIPGKAQRVKEQYDLDAEALIKKYGGDTLVTGIGFQAEKAYTNGDLLTKLEEYLQEEDGTEHSIGSISLPTTGGQAVLGLPTEEITLADMAGKKLGYRSS